MSILFELRYPTRWYSKLVAVAVVLVLFTVLATGAVSGFLLYRMVKPDRTSSEINMQSFPGRPEVVHFTVAGLGDREGWFFPGLRGAPTIVLCHGYQSSRGELLTLVSALQDHQYNAFVFDFAGHGKSAGVTTFGYREAAELRAAIDALAQRSDVDSNRFGVWGYNLGAYAALSEAQGDKRVRALVLDSVYDRPGQMVKVEIEKTGLAGFPLMVRSAQFSFRWMNEEFRDTPPLSKNLAKLAGVPKLFVQALDNPELAATTQQLFAQAPEPREQAILPRGDFVSMGDDDRKDYENRIVSFFLLRLPPLGAASR